MSGAARSAEFEAWVAKARDIPIENEIARRSIPLKANGAAERCGPCPVCGGEDRFSINTKKAVWNCRHCGKGGDVIDLVMHLDDVEFITACETLTGEPRPTPKGKNRAERKVAQFDYDQDGAVAFAVERIEYRNSDGSPVLTKDGKPKKSFRRKRPDPNRPDDWIWNVDGVPIIPYRLAGLTEAIANGYRVYIVEGEGKVDFLRTWNVPATCCAGGSKCWQPEHAQFLAGADVVIMPDNDPAGREYADAVAASLQGIATSIRLLELPGLPPKGDIIDWERNGGTVERLHELIGEAKPWTPPAATPPRSFPPSSLAEVHAIFQRWLGDEYDTATLNATLATAAAEQLPGDPPWLMIISGSGNAKTETVSSVSACNGAHVISTITSEGALLSAASKKSRIKGATGGLLRKIGKRGVLIIKDFTSILSMNREVRTAVLAAMREVHDGKWERNVGSDGGQTLTWEGRIVVIGACTTAWDQAHSVIASMGDRFVLVRSNSYTGRIAAGIRAIRNTGDEILMRREMAEAVAGLIGTVTSRKYNLAPAEEESILRAADVVTLARTGVELDYRGDVIDSHAPEMPTRFAKQLTMLMRGAVAIGMSREDALALVLRCARDSVPQLRQTAFENPRISTLSLIEVVLTRHSKPWRAPRMQKKRRKDPEPSSPSRI
jgi:hypothetical protein